MSDSKIPNYNVKDEEPAQAGFSPSPCCAFRKPDFVDNQGNAYYDKLKGFNPLLALQMLFHKGRVISSPPPTPQQEQCILSQRKVYNKCR